MAGGIFFRSFRIIPDICRIIPNISGRSVCRTWHFSRYGQCAKTASPAPAAQTAHRPSPFQNPQCCIYHFSDILSKTRYGAAWLRTAFQTAKNLVEFAPAGDSHHVVPPRGIAASAYAKKVPPALFLNAAASDKTQNARQVWNLCASSAQIMRAAGRSLFKREPSPAVRV